jgi:hypothetical protein
VKIPDPLIEFSDTFTKAVFVFPSHIKSAYKTTSFFYLHNNNAEFEAYFKSVEKVGKKGYWKTYPPF